MDFVADMEPGDWREDDCGLNEDAIESGCDDAPESVGGLRGNDGLEGVVGTENSAARVEPGDERDFYYGPDKDASGLGSPVTGMDTESPAARNDGPEDEPGHLAADLKDHWRSHSRQRGIVDLPKRTGGVEDLLRFSGGSGEWDPGDSGQH